MLEPWKEAGHETIAIDLKRGRDVRLLEKMNDRVDAVFAFPPCTVFANSGARWYPSRSNEEILEAISIMDACLRIVCVHRPAIWFLENPIGKMRRYLGDPALIFDPCEYAGYLEDEEERAEEAYTKRTLLWGHFTTPIKKPVPPVLGSKMHRRYGGKSERTKELRSITPRGFARAFFEANRP